ncbi:hypothetical protein [Mesorhizobium sp. M0579]|uniref:hypothetical protein n=1 Tax=Mesorhizobium sp. M0579 TaxID=2956962 RepID=UPI00333504B1
MTKYFVDGNGAYLGGFDGAEPPDNSIEVPEAPGDARQVWGGSSWSEVEALLDIPETISDRQFFQGLALPPYSIITKAEALAAVKTGEIPAAMVALVEALPEASRFGAEMLLSGATEFKRAHPLTNVFGQAFGWDSSQVDAFWISASAL